MIFRFFAGINFRGFVQKPRNPRNLIPLRYTTAGKEQRTKTCVLSVFHSGF